MSEYLSNNAHSDDEEDDRTSLSPLQVSWESNTSSNHCTICNASFGRLTKRRHHCRYCGRLVCGNCSRHRVYLQNLGINVPTTSEADQNNNRSKSSAASTTANQPVRVCDPCFRILTVKEEKIVEKRQLKEKKAEMLTSTSFISNCLVEIYFLDGEHTTITYDESTTVLEISQILYPTLPISLFEVMEDIYDPKQYILLQGNQNISQILQHWVMSGQKFAKLIFPVMISTLVKQPLNNIMKNLKEIKSNEENSSHFKASNAPVTSPDAEVSILQGEIDRLQYELDKANRKIETWRGIFNRTNRARTAEILEQNSLQDPSSDAMSVTDGNNDVSDTATVVSNMPVNASASKSAGRRSSFGWNVLGDVRSSIRSSIRMGLVGSSEPSKANNNDDVGDYSFSQQNKDSLLNASMMYNESNDDASSQPSSGKKATISRNPTINTRSSGASTDNLLSLLSANSGGNSLASTSLEELTSMFGNLNFGSNSTEVAILNNPIDFMKKDDSEVTLFVRTYFHHTINLMGFFSKYGNFFEHILKFIRTYLIEDAFQEEKRQLSLYHQRNYSNDNDNGGTRSTEDVMSQSAKDSFLFCKWVSSIYHMIVTLDTVYEQIIDYYDILRPALKQWLIVLFPQTIVLPISEPDRVKSIMSCLIKENLLLDNQILQSIQQSITNSIFQNILVVTSYNNTIGNTTSQHRTSYRTFTEMMKQLKDQLRHRTLSYDEVLSPLMKNILMTCQYIIGDYLQIFPSDIPVMTYFQTQSYEVWNVLIKPYYRELVNNQSSLSSSEMMITSKSSSSLPHSSGGGSGSGSVFFRLLEIYLFLEKYIILIDKFNPATSSKESLLFLERLKEKKIEIIGLLNTSLTQELKTKIKQLSTPSSSSSSSSSVASGGVGFEIVGNVENFRQVLKKVSQDDPSTSMTNNNNTASSRLRSRKSNTTLQQQGDDDHNVNDVSEGNNNNNTSSWLMLSSQYPLFQWCVELSQYYDSFLEYTFQQQEYMHAQGSNTSKGNIQITFFTLLLESIISDLLPMIHDYIHYQLKVNDKDYILKIITSMNSITYFHYQYIELMEEYCNNNSNSNNNMHMHNNHNNTYYFNDDIIEHYFENKILLIQTSLLDYHTMIIDMICRNYFFNDLKVCFTDTLFNNIWLKDMKGILSMKKMIRTGLLQFNALLLPASSGSSSVSDDLSGGSSNNSQNLAEIVKHKLLVSIIEGIISMYLELLFNNGYQQYPLLSMEVIDRLSEDLQMITSFFEELRQMILHYQYYAQNMHIIPILPKNKRKAMKALRFLSSNNTNSNNSNPTQIGGTPSTPTAAVEGSSKKKRSFFSSKRSTHSTSSSSLAGGGGGGGGMMSTVIGPKKELIIKNIQNKQLFDELLFPLQHVIYAIQMNKQHLLEFVKNEFYLDFGYYNSIRIWQLLLAWRGMKKEEIYQEYDVVLKDWRPEDIDSMEPKLYLTYLLHHKTNVLKITRQNEK